MGLWDKRYLQAILVSKQPMGNTSMEALLSPMYKCQDYLIIGKFIDFRVIPHYLMANFITPLR